jgi:hypothetical protein
LAELTDNIQKTVSIDKDFPILIDGLTGAGKSTIALQLAKKGCPWFDINSDVIFSREELIEKISTARLGSFIVIDEAINLLFKRDFMAKKQKFILKLLDMCRDRNLCLIMCVPNFWSIDKHILEGRIKLRIHVAKTGFAFMWKPTSNPFTPDKWNRKYNETVCYNWDVYPNARKTKGFIGYIKFGDMCESDKVKYLKIKEIKKEEIRKKEEEEEHKEQLDKEKGFVMGETMVLSLLREQGLLKKGALSMYASMRDIQPEALVKRVQRFDKKKVGQDNEDNITYYNNANKSNELNETLT